MRYGACVKTIIREYEDPFNAVYNSLAEPMAIKFGWSIKPSLIVDGDHYILFNKLRGGCSFRNEGDFYRAIRESVEGHVIILPEISKKELTKDVKDKIIEDSIPLELLDLAKKENLTISLFGPNCLPLEPIYKP